MPPTSLPRMIRSMPLTYTRVEPGEDGRAKYRVRLSSETPVRRWYGEEILDHSPEAIDLDRFRAGIAVLVDHDSDQVGILTDPEIGDDRALYADMVLSRSARGQEIAQDIEDGIRRYLSVGYRVHSMRLESSDDDQETYRVTRWEPLEGSIVSVPADPSAQFVRSAGEESPVVIEAESPAPEAVEEASMPMPSTATVAPAAGAEPTRADQIAQLAQIAGMADRAVGWICSDATIEDVRREIIASRQSEPIATPAAETLTLSEREQKDYSLARGINALVEGERSFEIEVSEELGRRMKSSKNGLLVPWSVRAGLDTKTSAAGGATVFTQAGSFIEALRNAALVARLGAQVLSGLSGPVSFPKQTGAASATWVAENPGSDVADSAATLGTVGLTPRTLIGTTSYSRQLLVESSIDVDNMVRGDLAAIAALAIDAAAIAGTGTNQPTGILSASNVNLVAIGTDGGAPTYDHIAQMSREIEVDNANIGSLAFLTTPGAKYMLKTTQQFSGTNGAAVWMNEEVDGYPAYASNQMPSTLSKGASSGILHAAILGAWSQLMVGLFGPGFEIVADPYRLKKQGMVELTIFQMADVALRYPECFCKIVDIKIS